KNRERLSNYARTDALQNIPEDYSIDPLQCRRLALLDPGAALIAAIAKQLVRQALVALLTRIGCFGPAQPAFRHAQPGRSLLARLTRAGRVDRLARLLGGAD